MTRPDPLLAESAQIAARAEAAIASNDARVQRIGVAGQFYWVKHEERLNLRMRIQKGDPHRAFEAERQAMHVLASAGVPVPPVVAEGADYFVTPDCGPSLRELLHRATENRLPAFAAAAEGLAGFHAKGLSHGRPSIKDVAWDGARATFLDFERFAPKRNQFSGHVQDLIILLFSAFAETGRPTPETRMLAEAYRAADPGGIWTGAERLCRRLRWVDPLTRPIQRLRSAREFRAIPLTFEAFGVV
jgi:tRNA A-37 threonylcarbamoyl transferase component Bud32